MDRRRLSRTAVLLAALAFASCIDFSLTNPHPADPTPDNGNPGGTNPGTGNPDGGTNPGGGSDGGGGKPDGGGSADGGGPVVATVLIKNMAFVPSQVTIRAGDTVTWVMQDPGEIHFIVEGDPDDPSHDFSSPKLSNGQTYSRTFTSSTTITYYCGQHPSTMSNAKVIVLP